MKHLHHKSEEELLNELMYAKRNLNTILPKPMMLKMIESFKHPLKKGTVVRPGVLTSYSEGKSDMADLVN
jgi:hypothetical protein